MLSTKFCAMTGRGLSEGNLKYLGNKLFGTSGTVDFSSAVVSWAQFNKVNTRHYNNHSSKESWKQTTEQQG